MKPFSICLHLIPLRPYSSLQPWQLSRRRAGIRQEHFASQVERKNKAPVSKELLKVKLPQTGRGQTGQRSHRA